MTDEQALLNHTAGRLATDPRFFSWYLAQYCDIEALSQDELCLQLQLSSADLPKLALCIAPDPGNPDFSQHIKNIAEYTGADAVQLAQIIRLVGIYNQQSAIQSAKIIPMGSPNADGILMAAREKDMPDAEPNPEKPE